MRASQILGTCALILLSSPLSETHSRLSGVEELLEEFRDHLEEPGPVRDVCPEAFSALEGHIIRTRDSLRRGAAFLAAPGGVVTRLGCVRECCAEERCTLAVLQEHREDEEEEDEGGPTCFLFDCGNACVFSPQRGYVTFSRAGNATGSGAAEDQDEPPRSDAGRDVIIQLPTDWVVLDGRGSVDDHGITRYEWVQSRGDPSINMKVTQPGILKLSGLQTGSYSFQMTVTDTAGQRSSDNVTVTVLPPKRQADVCTGVCSRYQFTCDDGCCIDITYACDGKQQCPDRSDEDFCQNFDGGRKAVTHSSSVSVQRPAAHREEMEDQAMLLGGDQRDDSRIGKVLLGSCSVPPAVGPCTKILPRWFYDSVEGVCKHFIYGGCKGNSNNFLNEEECIRKCVKKPDVVKGQTTTGTPSKPQTSKPPVSVPGDRSVETISVVKSSQVLGGHPVPESGAILPLALGLIITALLLLMVGCRLRLVRHKLKKARPITSEESDYLINGMYL